MIQENDFQKTANFAVLSISYEKADVETRGKFAFFEDNIKNFVTKLHEDNLGDAFVVSTCNRTEIYTTAPNYIFVAEAYCQTIGVGISDFLKFANILTKEEALRHLFRVSAGLESQIVGDFEIIGQIKKAYARFKKETVHTNTYLERSINSAIQISKKIKNQTSISSGAASVSYAAVHYMMNEIPALDSKIILLLGVGEIGQNTIENLVKHIRNPNISIANRTLEKAKKISEKYNILPVDFTKLDAEIDKTDVVIVATGAKNPLLFPHHFASGKKTWVIDLSIPSNVDPKVAELDHVTLTNVDQLSKQIQETLLLREKEIPKAEKIIKEMTKDFLEWEKKRKLAPNIHHFKGVLKKMEHYEMQKFYKKNRYININDMELSEKMIQKITNRFAKYIIDNPQKSEEVTKMMYEIFVEQPNKEFNEKH